MLTKVSGSTLGKSKMHGFRTRMLVALVVAASPALLSATTMEKQDLASVTSQADRIFTARVLSTESSWDAAEGQIFTSVEFEVLEGIRNADAGQRLVLRFLGGTATVPGLGSQTLDVPGIPQFATGSRVLLFAMDDPRLFCPIAGWFQGAFVVVTDPRSGKDVVCDHEGNYLSSLIGADVQVADQQAGLASGAGRVAVDEFIGRVRGLGTRTSGSSGPGRDSLPEVVHAECPHGSSHGQVVVVGEVAGRESKVVRSTSVALGLALLALGGAALAWSVRQGRKAGVR